MDGLTHGTVMASTSAGIAIAGRLFERVASCEQWRIKEFVWGEGAKKFLCFKTLKLALKWQIQSNFGVESATQTNIWMI